MDPFPRIVLVDLSQPIVLAWQKEFGETHGVEIRHGSIFEAGCDTIVSPGNSFGFMDGGIDRAITDFFGQSLQERVQQRIRNEFCGELLVGCAFITETGHREIRRVIVAPTMRVPMVLRESVNPYLATRAALLVVRQHGGWPHLTLNGPPVRSIAFSGMGTGVGGILPEICARQMRAALEAVFGTPPFPASWHDAQTRHQLLFRDETWDLQQE